MKDRPVRPVERPVGLETEYGILKPGDPYANPVALASRLVAAYGAVSRPALTGPDGERKSTRLNSSHTIKSRMASSA